MKAQERDNLLETLRVRFEKNMARHNGLAWKEVQARLERAPKAWDVLPRMENTGVEPDVIGFDVSADQYVFCDCSAERPSS
jgi:hypothetical protein